MPFPRFQPPDTPPPFQSVPFPGGRPATSRVASCPFQPRQARLALPKNGKMRGSLLPADLGGEHLGAWRSTFSSRCRGPASGWPYFSRWPTDSLRGCRWLSRQGFLRESGDPCPPRASSPTLKLHADAPATGPQSERPGSFLAKLAGRLPHFGVKRQCSQLGTRRATPPPASPAPARVSVLQLSLGLWTRTGARIRVPPGKLCQLQRRVKLMWTERSGIGVISLSCLNRGFEALHKAELVSLETLDPN